MSRLAIKMFVVFCYLMNVSCDLEQYQHIKCVLDFEENTIEITDSLYRFKMINVISYTYTYAWKLNRTETIEHDSLGGYYCFSDSDSLNIKKLMNQKTIFTLWILVTEKDTTEYHGVPLHYSFTSTGEVIDSVVVLRPEFY